LLYIFINMITVMFYGDIVGKPGRQVLEKHLAAVRDDTQPDLVIANAENASGGIGIEPTCANEIFSSGINLITTGNHIWQKKDISSYLENNKSKFLRPANFPKGAPGVGWTVFTTISGKKVAAINLIGRVFMPQLVDCPFRAFDEIISNEELQAVDAVFVDFHAEATSEKCAFAFHVDGRASLCVGTHTHVQTADEKNSSKWNSLYFRRWYVWSSR
jgi:2',3'-cyclic-nucleotide 2'-phosphodiesterase